MELIIYAEAPEYIGEPEISESEWENLAPVEGVSFHEVRQNDRGRWYLKARVGEDYRWKQIPDIWFLMLADDGTKSTVIRVGWQNKICIQIPPQTDANLAENLPINELREIIAIALSTALYKPELIENGAPIVRFPGYPKSNWFKPNEYYTGVDYPSVPCGTCESGILNFIGIYSLANQCDREVALVSLIKPGSGTTIVARNLDYLIARLKAGWKEGQIALGNENLADFEESGKGLASGKGSTDNPWLLLPPSNEQVKLRLFCFHASGCGASMYRTWAEYLPPTIAVCPIQLPGRETRLDEPLFTELSALARELAQALLPYLDLPFACFGHSMGALTSFEVVRQLRHLKAPKPVRLFVSSHRAPQIPLPSQPTHQFSDEIFIETLHHRFGSFPEETRQNTMLMRYVLPILRADLQMCETYTYLPEAPLDCPISAFGGLQDCTVTPHELRSWGKQTRQSCRLQMFPGGHFYFTEDPAPLLHAIAHQLQPILDPMTLSNSRNQTEG